jgi:hypothetical protein
MVIGASRAGRGIPAAGHHGRLRCNALRAYGDRRRARPTMVVDRVHRLTEAFEDVSFATFLYLLLDAASGEARYRRRRPPSARWSCRHAGEAAT